MATTIACAQTVVASEPVSVAQEPALSKNPTFLFRTLSASEEFDRLAANGTQWTTTVGYTETFHNSSMSVGGSLPFGAAASTAGSPAGDRPVVLGEGSFKAQWIPYVTSQHGVLLTTSMTVPSAGDDRIGDGKWLLTPSVAYARFWGPRLLVAQFFQQQVSFAGPAGRSKVNRSDLDLYSVYSSRTLRWWLTGDLNLRVDEANHDHVRSAATVGYGRGLRKVFGGTLNGSVQAAAGVGRYRPYDYMISGGLSMVGFQWKR